MRETAPWTIKNVPVKVRQLALKCANAQDQTMAEWMADAVHKLAGEQAGMVIPPKTEEDRQPHPDDHILNLDLVGIAAAIQASLEAHKAVGKNPPASLARDSASTVRLYLRVARGLPEKAPGSRRPKTIEHLEADHERLNGAAH